ncbi:NAD(P)/FAD-dependent oxidoreductase [Candidatus Amarobacter glycogenicus]|uniref:dihydrolipoyl dehydrogenase family protein n=1 Tax=Candidatus Amarobacter glycogenicus TaxID=3140699 RepID=UPI003136B42B|nr:NAD(P)/FAD-dependent oxidoreductase [Dehalococcoidia bacterium]
MSTYDLIVIGNGSAGDNIARTLGRKGQRVAVVESEHLGGECLNDGCIPSKALIHLSKDANSRGMGWDEVVASIHSTQLRVRGSDPNGGMRGDGIDLYWGEAVFGAPTRVRAGASEISATNVVIATGTGPGLPPIPGLADARPQTNRTIFTLAQLPSRLAVIGGGPIGLELGQSFLRLGSSVTLFEAAPRIAGTEDPEVSMELTGILEREGMRVVAGAQIQRVDRSDDGAVTVTTASGRFIFDEVLVAAGRLPQVPAGLAELGLELDKRGFVAISPCGKTNLDGLWAAGDITGKFQFTHFASYQAHHIGKHIESGVCEPIPETTVPWAIFTEPEIGHAGMTEEQARADRAEIRVARLDAAELDWFRTTGQTDGFAKVIADGQSGVLLGAHFICARGSTLVGEACLAIQHGLTARQVASTVHPYPTASELFRWACAKVVD